MPCKMVAKIIRILTLATMFSMNYECKSIQNGSVNTDLVELKQTVMDLSVKVESLNQSLQHKNSPVLFYAIMKGHHVRNVDTTLVFETVIVNEGGYYDKYDGVFVAPEKGIYLFSWTATGYATKYIVTELVVEEKIISSAGERNGGGDYPSGSMTALCKMDKGDHAWIRTTGVSSEHNIYSLDNYPQTAFLGILIRKE